MDTSTLCWREKTLILMAALLFAIWPLPHTIALRWTLLGVGALLAGWIMLRHGFWRTCLRAPALWCIAGLFGWVCVHTFVIQAEPATQMRELTGLWARTACAVVMAAALGCLTAYRPIRVTWPLVLGLMGTPLIYSMDFLVAGVRSGDGWPENFFQHLYINKPPLVMFGSIAAAAAMALLVSRLSDQRRQLTRLRAPRLNLLCVLMLAVVVFMFLSAPTRNGMVILAALVGAGLVAAIAKKYATKGFTLKTKAALMAVVLSLGLGGASYLRESPEWHQFAADARVAIDLDGQQAWRTWDHSPNFAWPQNEHGQTVNYSNYFRVAWATAGVRLVAEHPLGFGVVESAFGRLGEKTWPGFRGRGETYGWLATHSGWLDFTLGLGVPATVLVLCAVISATRRAQKTGVLWAHLGRWLTLTIALVFVIAEVSSSYFIEAFLFWIAFTAMASACRVGVAR